jgi:hypothetical protein
VQSDLPKQLEINMPNNVNEVQQLGKANMDAATESFGAASKGFQAIAAEVANYSNRSLQGHMTAMEQLMATKSPEQAMQVQTEYVKSAYEAYVAEGTKITELYSNLCKDCYKPFADVIGNKSP